MTQPLIRPPVLTTNENPGPSAPAPLASPQLDAYINSVVTRIVNAQLHGESDHDRATDQEVTFGGDNLEGLEKIPDVVKGIEKFSGEVGQFSSWKKSVERVLNMYEQMRGSSKYFGILTTIRNKIVGQADLVLEAYNTPLNWSSISKCLTLHYADQRDVRTLEYQMTSLRQGNSPVQEFYQRVYTHLSLILNSIASTNEDRNAIGLLTKTYRDKALDTFIRGLNGDLPRLLGMKEPENLPEALHLCLKLENQDFRSQFAYYHSVGKPRMHGPPPQTLPKRNNVNSQTIPFYPQLAYIPNQQNRPTQTFQYNQHNSGQPNYFQPNYVQPNYVQPNYVQPNYVQRNSFVPQRPIAPKPQPKPEPMEIDSTIQTRRVNYTNRPQYGDFHGKRPANTSMRGHPAKQQRNFNIEAGNVDNYLQAAQEQYYALSNSDDTENFQDGESTKTQDQFEESQQGNYSEEVQLFTDIHFLD